MMQGDINDREGSETAAGHASSAFPLGLGEPVVPYAIVDFTVALKQQRSMWENPPVGVTIGIPEPDLEEDTHAGLRDMMTGTAAADRPAVCQYEASRFYDLGILNRFQQTQVLK
jgi:hypothetical protein